jgi:hypothetical protein
MYYEIIPRPEVGKTAFFYGVAVETGNELHAP